MSLAYTVCHCMTHQTWRLVREGKKEWEFLQVLPGPHPHRWGHTRFSFHASPKWGPLHSCPHPFLGRYLPCRI